MSVSESSIRYEGWRVAAASAAGVFFAAVVVYGFGVLLKPLAEQFSWSRETTASAYSSFALASAFAAPLIGRLLDRYGPTRVAVPCVVLCGVGIVQLSTLSGSRLQLYAIFIAMGVAATGTSPLAYSRAVATWFDRRRGTALAIVMAGAAAASIVHPPMIDALIRSVGWQQACRMTGGFVLAVGLPIIIVFVRERGVHQQASRGSIGDARAALRSWIFWVLVGVIGAAALAFSGIVIHIIALLTDRGVSPSRAAMTLSLMGAAGLAGRLLTGALIDRFRATYVSAALLTLAAGGLLLLSTSHGFEWSLVAAMMIGFGMGGELDVTPFLLSRYFGLRSLATLYGFAWTATGSGAAAGSVLMGRAFDGSGTYDGMLMKLAATTLVAAVLMLLLPDYRLSMAEQPVSTDLRG